MRFGAGLVGGEVKPRTLNPPPCPSLRACHPPLAKNRCLRQSYPTEKLTESVSKVLAVR